MILFRPVDKAEYELIAQSGFTAYPPRFPEQPIFYPVLNERYAREIAEKWNRRDPNSQYTGYVTTFEIDDEYISRFEVQTVGARYHQEFWIPAEELNEFNSHLVGKIKKIEDGIQTPICMRVHCEISVQFLAQIWCKILQCNVKDTHDMQQKHYKS